MKIRSKISDRITKFLIRFLIEYFWYNVFVIWWFKFNLLICNDYKINDEKNVVVFVIVNDYEFRRLIQFVISITIYNYLVVSLSIEMIFSWKFTFEIVVFWMNDSREIKFRCFHSNRLDFSFHVNKTTSFSLHV